MGVKIFGNFLVEFLFFKFKFSEFSHPPRIITYFNVFIMPNICGGLQTLFGGALTLQRPNIVIKRYQQNFHCDLLLRPPLRPQQSKISFP